MDTDALTVKLDAIHLRLDEFEKRLDKVLDDHETRLRRLEKWAYAMPPTLLIAAGSILVTIATR